MSFLDDVCAEHEELARVLRKHRGIRRTVEDLYPDRAHFIYELLQNAEDACATEAIFHLSETNLVLEHDGRDFTRADVKAITDIGEGTKADDADQIGKFGLGFKAVFAYCETPRVWSPSFSFEIRDLVLPKSIAAFPKLGRRTRFEFPFNSPKKPTESAYAETRDGLEELSSTTLLFLSNLKSVEWQIGSGAVRRIRRIEYGDDHVEVLRRIGENRSAREHFLRFSDAVKGLSRQKVVIAFALEALEGGANFNPKRPLAKQFRIVSANPGRVAVFFPAEKETSGLHFHVHAPFATELSRASVKDTPLNEPLFQQLAATAVGSLNKIKKLGLLTGEFLAVLPNTEDELPDRYAGIRLAIVDAMKSLPLTPTHYRTHAPANDLFQAKAGLKELLSEKDLRLLSESGSKPVQWAIGATQRNSRQDHFLDSLEIAEWDVSAFVNILEKNAASQYRWNGRAFVQGPEKGFMTWLASKGTEWHQRFYALLYSELVPQRQVARLRALQLVRLSDGKYVAGEGAYFPSDGIDHDARLPRVARGVYTSGKSKVQREQARKLLAEVGVREVGEEDEVGAILRERYTKKAKGPPSKDYWVDLDRFISLVAKSADNAELFKAAFIFETDSGEWETGNNIFIDAPFQVTGLRTFYDALESTSSRRSALSGRYAERTALDLPRFLKFAKALAAQVRLEVSRVSCGQNPMAQHLVWTAPGNWSNAGYGVNQDYTIQGLKEALTSPTVEMSRLVWTTLIGLNETKWFLARYRNNSNYLAREAPSQLASILRDAAWIPQTTGQLVKPSEASSALLPEGFPFDPGYAWLKAIDFAGDTKKRSEEAERAAAAAKDLGFQDLAALARARQFSHLPEAEQVRLLAEAERLQQLELPEHSPRDPARRGQKVSEEAIHAPERRTEERSRSIAVGRDSVKTQAKQYLVAQYTNDGITFCQICKAALPFQVADGSFFFETVEFFDGLKRMHAANFLALCPNHAAMFQHANSSRELLPELLQQAEENAIEIELAGRTLSAYFTTTHLLDLLSILAVERGDADAPPRSADAAAIEQATVD